MKRRVPEFITLLILSVALYSQNDQVVCNLGFTFKISNNPNWGNNEPVVTDITPGSPADKAGLKVNDIILEVNGNGTYLKPAHTIMSWFMERTSRHLSNRCRLPRIAG
jgi:C-terminal processing protease CtpA/Prc